MQIAELKAMPPESAVHELCKLADMDLDRLAAEVQGWTPKVQLGGQRMQEPFLGIYKADGMYVTDYRPSRCLDQAYALLATLHGRQKGWVFKSWLHTKRGVWLLYNNSIGFPGACDHLSQERAGTHERAVTILAIVGLLDTWRTEA